MKRHKRLIAIVGVVLVAGICGYLLFGETDRTDGQFPELRPALEAPAGYSWEFQDGPDFYTWVMAEKEMAGDRNRSGIGIYFGLHPQRSAVENAMEQMSGRAVSRKVTWSVTRSNESNSPWVKRDTFLKYNHGREYRTIGLHIWVWGQTEEQVAELAKHVENMEVVDRN
jgi:hypothetical protein